MTARARFHRWLCSFWWRLRHGRPEHRFHVPQLGLRPLHLVVVMPPEFGDFEAALPTAGLLIERLSPLQATVVVADNFRNWLPRTGAWNLLVFDKRARGWLGFPDHAALRRVTALNADVVVDLTPCFHPYTNALAAATGAPLRVSLCAEKWNCYHNYLIQLDPSRPLAERYRLLLGYV
ncbi:hypothetical protein KKH27_11665 [bacterium]|nr:hypothetical protein [bacterium]MBU1985270.1 hypothetical protein [bacterium]